MNGPNMAQMGVTEPTSIRVSVSESRCLFECLLDRGPWPAGRAAPVVLVAATREIVTEPAKREHSAAKVLCPIACPVSIVLRRFFVCRLFGFVSDPC